MHQEHDIKKSGICVIYISKFSVNNEATCIVSEQYGK